MRVVIAEDNALLWQGLVLLLSSAGRQAVGVVGVPAFPNTPQGADGGR